MGSSVKALLHILVLVSTIVDRLAEINTVTRIADLFDVWDCLNCAGLDMLSASYRS